MFTRSVNSLADAHGVILDYHLNGHGVFYPFGSADGFAYYLAQGPGQHDSKSIAIAIKHYLKCEEACAADELDFQDELKPVVDKAEEERAASAARHRAFAGYVRMVKYDEQGGGLVWETIALLATSDGPAPLESELHAAVADVLERIAGFANELPEFLPMQYVPGADATLDHMVRLDIERLDTSLISGPPWPGCETYCGLEMSALLGLACKRPAESA